MKKYIIGLSIIIAVVVLITIPYLLKRDSTVSNKPLSVSTALMIDISDFKFTPSSVKIKNGATIEWINNDSVPHTVTTDASGQNSGLLRQGEIYSYTFNETGVFNYYCDLHRNMRGTVEVTD